MNPRIASMYSILCFVIMSAKIQNYPQYLGYFRRLLYFCRMKERINWIDWTKALAVYCVVFCHLPQSQDWFYYRYLQADIITIFFFISGYMKKDHGSDKANWQKYWHSLILPYLLYNAIVYPYWLVKFYMLNGSMPDLSQAMMPIIHIQLTAIGMKDSSASLILPNENHRNRKTIRAQAHPT